MVCFFRLFLAIFFFSTVISFPSHAKTPHIVAFGDSITAGYGLSPNESFPSVLEEALHKKGYATTLTNAGISGDTTAGGEARINHILSLKPDIVILALGANDMLRGIPPETTRAHLSSMLETLTQAKVSVVLVGMKASLSLGPVYMRNFNAIYPELAKEYDVPLYPFLLEDVALKPAMNQEDGLHPNAAGATVIAENLLPYVENLLEEIK